MRKAILFDTGVPRPLRRLLLPHRVTTTQELAWEELKNGNLLKVAQADFDVLISTDANIKYQQRLDEFDIALIILRAFRISLKSLTPLVPQLLTLLETIEAGQVIYLYADASLMQKDQRKGQRK
ncbi:MAG: hypothetical protein HYR56_00255 [Acidobacteria bacterium]|nr:hypothetical protein [Acidobacteriota bacterium]MBI3421700.1 hypothetical protein [Acidobacteriota bacterium]